jgi:hypothetical protein
MHKMAVTKRRKSPLGTVLQVLDSIDEILFDFWSPVVRLD